MNKILDFYKAIRHKTLPGVLLVSIVLLTLTLVGLKQTALWFDYNRIVFEPLSVQIDWPRVYTEERPTVSPIIQLVQEFPSEATTPVERAVVEMWGPYESKVALAVMRAESGGDCNAWNANTNNTIDLGLFQINSIHFDEDFTAADALDCQKNIVKAYEIWEDSGWEPWVAFWSGSFRKHL